MDDPNIPINGKDGFASLRVECDFEASTSLTCASTLTTTPLSTPTGDDRTGNGGGSNNNNNNNELSSEFIALYERLDRTPPKAACTAKFQETLMTANALLELSDVHDFQNLSFYDLKDDQQAILIHMIMKGMDTIFDVGRCQKSANILINALRPESDEYKRMMSFVRKGGDRYCPIQTLLHKKVVQDIRKFDIARNVTTIFTHRPDMSPFLHLQREDSYICTYNACSELLYYASHNNEGENDDENITTIKMNISRYIRDEVSGCEIANFTLTTYKGAILKRVLLVLMKSFGTVEYDNVEMIPTWDQNEDENFLFFKTYLNNGRPFVFTIECFPGLAKKDRFRYTGKLGDYYKNVDISNKRPEDPKHRLYHALLCIGIKPREGPLLPPMLLVQDSCRVRPIFEIGLDLLMDMGLDNLDLCTVPKKWTFNKKMDYMVSPETKALICGSPMSLDDTGVPHIIMAEKHVQVQQREDMSPYLDKVIAKPGEPIVVIT